MVDAIENTTPTPAPDARPAPGRWRPDAISLVAAALALAGLLAMTYPSAASWISQYNQSKVITEYTDELDTVRPDKAAQVALAHEYNDALNMGALLEANTRIPTGSGASTRSALVYEEMLRANGSGLMGRIKIPSIDADLPIYHGTSDATLLKGVGHLEGTSLPVGGPSTRTVLTAHRGLADAKMFTDMDRVKAGDTFTLEIFGEVLTYRVRETRVVDPEETESLRVEEGADLATLVTCTPLGINSHRILVTGVRVEPTPAEDLENAGAAPEVPRFPWWLLILAGGLALIGWYVRRSGMTRTLPVPAGRSEEARDSGKEAPHER